MPQIDIVTYFPIILWTLLFVGLGFILFNVYMLLEIVSIMKLFHQWRIFSQGLYWVYWNKEEVVDSYYWTIVIPSKIKPSDSK